MTSEHHDWTDISTDPQQRPRETDKSSAQTPTASNERVRPGAARTTVQFYHAYSHC